MTNDEVMRKTHVPKAQNLRTIFINVLLSKELFGRFMCQTTEWFNRTWFYSDYTNHISQNSGLDTLCKRRGGAYKVSYAPPLLLHPSKAMNPLLLDNCIALTAKLVKD